MKMETTQRGMTLTKPVPLVTEYVTVDISAEGDPIFLTDIYKFDKAYEKGTLPPKVKTLWGSPNLRPGWVPRVARKIVQSWRAEGQPAPRDYDPNKPPSTE